MLTTVRRVSLGLFTLYAILGAAEAAAEAAEGDRAMLLAVAAYGWAAVVFGSSAITPAPKDGDQS